MPRTYVRLPRNVACVDCGVLFTTTGHNAKRCDSCRPAAELAYSKKWRDANLEAERKARRDRYNADIEATRARNRAKYAERREENNEYQRQWALENKDRISLQRRCRQFGLTMDELVGLFAAQDETCPVCALNITIKEPFDVDHCHDTGKVRAVLHPLCNRGIGLLGDDADNCERAAAYLRSHKS